MLRKDAAIRDRVWRLVSLAQQKPPVQESITSKHEPLAIPQMKTQEEMLDAIDLGCTAAPEGHAGRLWFLDPIDGTKTFLSGNQYAVALCLTINEEQKVGVLGCPNLPWSDIKTGTMSRDVNVETLTDPAGYGSISYAIAGMGSFVAELGAQSMGEPVLMKRSSIPASIKEARFLDSTRSSSRDHHCHNDVYKKLSITAPPMGIWATQMKYIALALGAGDAWFRCPPANSWRQCPWDHAGGMLIYTEAGGMFSNIRWNRHSFSNSRYFDGMWGYIVTDASLYDELKGAIDTVLTEHGKPPADLREEALSP